MTRAFPMIALFTAVLALSASEARADTFKSSEFLKWSPEGQRSYIQTSVGMAAAIAAQIGGGKAQCIGEWYFADPEARQMSLLASMRENGEFHPQAVILALIQKQCGLFKR